MKQEKKGVTKKEIKKMMRDTEKKDMKEDKEMMEHHVDTMHKRYKEHR